MVKSSESVDDSLYVRSFSKESMARELKAKKMPFYSYPKCEPSDVFDFYKFGVITGTREIHVSSGSRHGRQSEIYRIDPKIQKVIWSRITSMTEITPYVISVSSSVTDWLAYEVASTLVMSLLRTVQKGLNSRCVRWGCVTPYHDPYKENEFMPMSANPDILIIRSVTPQDKTKIANIKNILDYYYFSTRILVVGGVNGIDYFDKELHYPLHGAFHVEGYKGTPPKYLWLKDERGQSVDGEGYNPLFTLDTDMEKHLGEIAQNSRIKTVKLGFKRNKKPLHEFDKDDDD